jgi:UDP-N-acetylglucosamine--N-acetylmuramyl-(pentapeptide) pyrophosphoryl-undecaprenol N-acetylglucosamine transferase
MRVVLSGGGSGGHIYPALAIARGLTALDKNTQILYLGTGHGLETTLVPRENIPFKTIHARGLVGIRGAAAKAAGVLSAVRGLIDALALLRKFKPDVVVGTGGYVCGPVGLAANWLGIPLVLQEQNALPGLTNRSLAGRAQTVLVPFEEAVQHFPPKTHVILAGNPVNLPKKRLTPEEARRELGLSPDIRLLMTTGGSQGAQAVNGLMLDLLPEVAGNPQLGLIWATGRRYFEEVQKEVAQKFSGSLDSKRIQIVEYFYEIALAYQAADLFVGRAGMMTITDCQAYGVPMVLIPSPNVSEDHQTRNAEAMVRRGAGILLKEAELNQRQGEVLELLQDRERLAGMQNLVHELFDDQALDRILKAVKAAAFAARGRK